MVSGGVIIVHYSLAVWVDMFCTQRPVLVALRLSWHHALTLLHENTFNIVARHWTWTWIALRLLALDHKLGAFVIIAWTVEIQRLLILVAWIVAVNIWALPDTQRLLVHLLAGRRFWDKGVSHLRQGLCRGPFSKIRGAVDCLPFHSLPIRLQMVLVLRRSQIRLRLRLKSHNFWIFRRLNVLNLINHVGKPVIMCLSVLLLHFRLMLLILVECLFRRLSAAFTIVFLWVLIVLAKRVHLFVFVVEGFAVKEHLVAVGWRFWALDYIWVVNLHLLKTAFDCCVVHDDAGRIIHTELLLLFVIFRAFWSLAAWILTARVLMGYAAWSLVRQHSQSIIVDLVGVELLSDVLNSLIVIYTRALARLALLQLRLVYKLLDEGRVQQVLGSIVLLLILVLMLGMSRRLLCLVSVLFIWLGLFRLWFWTFINFNKDLSRVEILLLHNIFVYSDLVFDLRLNIS